VPAAAQTIEADKRALSGEQSCAQGVYSKAGSHVGNCWPLRLRSRWTMPRLYSELSRANARLEREINERLRAEAAVRRSEAYLTEAESLSKSGSWAFNPRHERDHPTGRRNAIACLDLIRKQVSRHSRRFFSEFIPRIGESGLKAAKTQFVKGEIPNSSSESFSRTARSSTLYGVGHPIFSESGDLVEVMGFRYRHHRA